MRSPIRLHRETLRDLRVARTVRPPSIAGTPDGHGSSPTIRHILRRALSGETTPPPREERLATVPRSILAFARPVLRVVTACFALLAARPASAQSAAAMPFYVSDRFQQIAEKAAQHVALELITKACPDAKPLCHAMVEKLRDATAAAFARDRGALKVSLNDFFVSSSSAALMDTALGELVSADAAPPELARVLVPVARCLGSVVDRRAARTACAFTPAELSALREAIVKTVCGGVRDAPCAEAARLEAALAARVLDAGEIARALASLAGRDPIRRPDLQIYLGSLAEFLDRHPEGGLFDAAHAFVTSVRSLHLEKTLLNRDFSQYLLLAQGAGSFTPALRACGGQEDALAGWQGDEAKDLALRYREDLVLGRAPDLSPILALLRVDEARCPGAADRAKVAQLKSFARTLKAQLDVASALQRYATVGLLAAAALDFARSGNAVELDGHVRRTILFGLAQVIAQAQMTRMLQAERAGGPEVTAISAVRAHHVLRSCELQGLAVLEQLPGVVDSPGTLRCVPLAGGAPQPLPGSVAADLGEVARQDVTSALDGFASVVQRERAGDYDRVLGALLTAQSAKLVARLRAPLAAIQVSPADPGARAALQSAALELAKDAGLKAESVAAAPRVDERQFGPLLAMTDGERRDLRAVPAARRTQGQRRLAAALEDPALASARTLLGLPVPHRVATKAAANTRAERVALFFAGARKVLDSVAPDLQASAREAGLDVDLIVKGVTAGAGEQEALSRKLLLDAAAGFLVQQVGVFTDRLVGAAAGGCAAERERAQWHFIWDGLAGPCVVKLLIDGAYRPIAEFIWADDFRFTADSAASLADKGYRSLVASPALGHTMLLLNVGLGASFVSARSGPGAGPDPARKEFVALTLLDKLGFAVARYRSPSSQFEVGPFVGGFLDALARTASDAADRYWVGGATAGWSRMWGLDLGLQVHGGWAFPFTFHSDPRPTVGVTLVVPFSYAFE